MKPLHWAPIEDKLVKTTVWNNINDETISINTKVFEQKFAATAEKKKTDAKPKKVEIKTVSLVDGKRSYNINIVLARLRMPHEELRDALLHMDETVLTEERIGTLAPCAPEDAELDLVMNYNEDKSLLGTTEKFFLVIGTIPRVAARFECLNFKLKFHEVMQNCKEKLFLLESAIQVLRTSRNVRKALEIVLALGNYLNGGGRNGGKSGFKLNTLSKLTGTKTVDNKQHLVHFMVEMMEEKYPEAMGFGKELTNLDEALRVDLKFLTGEIAKVNQKVGFIDKELKDVKIKDKTDKFKDVMRAFRDHAQPSAESLKVRASNVTDDGDQLIKYFGEDPSKTTLEELVKIFYAFGKDFQESWDEVKEMRAKAKEEEKRQQRLEDMKNRNTKVEAEDKKEKKAGEKPEDTKDIVAKVNAQLTSSNTADLRTMLRQRRQNAKATGAGNKRTSRFQRAGELGLVPDKGRNSGSDLGKPESKIPRVGGKDATFVEAEDEDI